MHPMSSAELRVAIAALGLTQEGLADILFVGKRTMRNWLTDGVKDNPAAILIRIMVARRNWSDLLTIGYGGS